MKEKMARPEVTVFKKPEAPKAAEPKIGRAIKVPPQHVERFWKLFDAPGNLGRYRFWTFVGKILPETKEGIWGVRAKAVTEPEVFEQLDGPAEA